MKKIFFILIAIFIFSSCTKYNSEIVYRVERPDGVISDTINYVTFNSTCMVKHDNGNFVLILDDNINRRGLLVSKHPIVIESFNKIRID